MGSQPESSRARRRGALQLPAPGGRGLGGAAHQCATALPGGRLDAVQPQHCGGRGLGEMVEGRRGADCRRLRAGSQERCPCGGRCRGRRARAHAPSVPRARHSTQLQAHTLTKRTLVKDIVRVEPARRAQQAGRGAAKEGIHPVAHAHSISVQEVDVAAVGPHLPRQLLNQGGGLHGGAGGGGNLV